MSGCVFVCVRMCALMICNSKQFAMLTIYFSPICQIETSRERERERERVSSCLSV